MATLLTAAGLFLFWNLRTYAETTHWVNHTQDVLQSAQQLRSLVLDAETGQRGFLLTGEDHYLEPYRQAVPQFTAQIQRLRQLTADNPRQQQRLARLVPLTQNELAELNETIRRFQEEGADARTLALRGRNKIALEQMRSLLDQVEAEEHALLNDRLARRQQQVFRLVGSTGAAILLGSFLLLRTRAAQRRAEHALRESENRFRTMFEQAPVGIVIIDPASESLVDFNALSHQQLGYTRDEFASLRLRDIVTLPDDPRQRHAAAMASGDTYRFVSQHRTQTGEMRDVRVTTVPLSVAGHTYAYAVVEDVTERQRSETALRDSEAQFSTLANAIPQLCWMANADGWIFWYNQRWYEYTGTTPDQMEGWGWQRVHDPEVLPSVMAQWTGAIGSGMPFDMTFPLRGADGVFRPFLTRVMPVRDAQNRVTRWVGTNTDVREQKRVEAELRRANQALEQFAFSASHDLQEPLRNVAIYSQLLQKRYGPQLDADGGEFLGYLVEGAQRMGHLVSDLLAYTQAASLTGEPVTGVDAEGVFRHALNALQRAIQESGASVTHQPLPSVAVQAVHLEQLFQNLIDNAIKYRKDQEPPQVQVSATKEGGYWRFSVQDNGIGIAPEYHEKVFGIFKRLHAKGGKYPGTGMGLAICQKIVEQYGGSIWVESKLDVGATFHFTLPAAGAGDPSDA